MARNSKISFARVGLIVTFVVKPATFAALHSPKIKRCNSYTLPPGNPTLPIHDDLEGTMISKVSQHGYEVADFAELPGVACPCGTARRAFADVVDFPGTIHVTDISTEARLHYHKQLTETYYFLECEADAQMQLDDELIDVRAGMCVMIRPGTRHRAVGRMKVLIVVLPKFDPNDEWFD